MKIKLLVLTIFLGMLTGCSLFSSKEPTTGTGGTGSLAQLQQLSPGPASSTNKGPNAVRSQALEETALSTGAQAGLAWRAKQINEILDQNQRHLSRIFDFNALLLDHSVLPPVLVEGKDSLNLADDYTIRLADRSYQIVGQAHFVTAPPHWRDYLWMNYDKPTRPDTSLLPINKFEEAIWKRFVTDGWHQGINQANTIYAENLARLKRDYMGMILYRKLLAQNMVSAPFVAKSDLGITGGGSDMRIHDQILKITALPTLRANSKTWKPSIH